MPENNHPITEQVPNLDTRHMQPLPWSRDSEETGKCITLVSANNRAICSFWGGDARHPKNFEWCTEAQMKRHAEYAEHAIKHFPLMQSELERMYAMDDMPEEAIQAIETLMGKIYLTFLEVPPHV